MIVTAEMITFLRRVARALVPRDEIDDLVQDALVDICAALQLPADAAIEGWMSTVLYRTHFANRRAAKRMKRDAGIQVGSVDDLLPARQPRVGPTQLLAVELSEIDRTLRAMPQKWAMALRSAAEGGTIAEIMREQGISRDTAMIWLANARRLLRDPDLLGTRVSFRGLIQDEA